MTALRRWRIAPLLYLLLGLVGLLLVALCTLLYTPWGWSVVRTQGMALFAGALAGRLEIDAIDLLELGRLRARGVRFYAPDGSLGIDAPHAALEFDLQEMLAGRYGWRRADVERCTVYLTEDKQGKLNLEETFKGKKEDDAPKKNEPKKKDDGPDIDMRAMATHGCRLLISGGSLPSLDLVDLDGIMRVHVAPDGRTDLRFDGYRGLIRKGLPTGKLDFRDVFGTVQTDAKQLLHFHGQGRSEGADVRFALDIFTKPEKRVSIEATFPELSAPSVRALGVAAYTKLSPTLELQVHHGKE